MSWLNVKLIIIITIIHTIGSVTRQSPGFPGPRARWALKVLLGEQP